MLSFSKCTRTNLCVDCDDDKCLHKGKLLSDCPKYHCDNSTIEDCENCAFMKDYIEKYRRENKL